MLERHSRTGILPPRPLADDTCIACYIQVSTWQVVTCQFVHMLKWWQILSFNKEAVKHRNPLEIIFFLNVLSFHLFLWLFIINCPEPFRGGQYRNQVNKYFHIMHNKCNVCQGPETFVKINYRDWHLPHCWYSSLENINPPLFFMLCCICFMYF